ncbi:hypothetical protein NDU88_001288 [Pleurodeles waltl]|uniref:Uncharacterized protein n=1 Tax=Pleurodeles waltl TaxID=8319 RepID=A0AAV7KSA7_PLEWA|nr:hypothetical protein NDU88_001288 [Pleurodeles waltl]
MACNALISLTSETLRRFSFCRVGVHRFFCPLESDASSWSAHSGPGRPGVVFTHSVVFASEIQPHDDTKTTQRRLRSQQPPSAMRASIFRSRCWRASIFSCEAGGLSIFQQQFRVVSIFSLHSGLCMDFSLFSCQLLLSGSQELDGPHLAEYESQQRLQVLAESSLCCPWDFK